MQVEKIAKCICGEVEILIKGPVLDACFCHCNICRQYTKQLCNAVAVLPGGTVQVLKGEPVPYATSDALNRYHCPNCGGDMYEDGHGFNMQFVMLVNLIERGATEIPEGLKPSKHIYYTDRVFDVNDDLPKYHELDWDYEKQPPEPIPKISDEVLKATTRAFKM